LGDRDFVKESASADGALVNGIDTGLGEIVIQSAKGIT
jgi:hypothetical protein